MLLLLWRLILIFLLRRSMSCFYSGIFYLLLLVFRAGFIIECESERPVRFGFELILFGWDFVVES